MTQIAPVLGVLAALVGIANTVPYVRDTVRRSTRPHRGTWLIWSMLAIVVCLSQRADGASRSLVMAGTHAVLNAVIFFSRSGSAVDASARPTRSLSRSPLPAWPGGLSPTSQSWRRSASSGRT